MHASLAELFENLRPGLLWVTRDCLVRFVNADAAARTGLATGDRLFDPDMTRAVAACIDGRVPRTVASVGAMGGDGAIPAELKCRVIPGLSHDDAFVLIAPDHGHDEGAGFDNLMQAIRSDVRDPLREAKAALAVAESQGSSDEHTALHDGLGQLLTVVDRLVELASLWDGEALLANDRIELWPLLQRAWGDVEPLALQRGVKVRFRAQTEAGGLATLYGSERWLCRVFQECLESAVRSTRRDGMLDIEHRQLGPRAMVVFRDCGGFAPHQQIGLRLCQHIVSSHGGQLREEEEDGLRNLLIELPTGAPHRLEQPQLDIAQAQQYAQDLAALRTRSRKRKAAAAPAAVDSSD